LEIIVKIINKQAHLPVQRTFQTALPEIDDEQQIVDELNRYFCNIGITLSNSIAVSPMSYTSFLPPSPCSSAVFDPTDEIEIKSIIANMNNSTSVGVDEIPSSVIKLAAKYYHTLSCLINNSLVTCCFPEVLKLAEDIPIFKSGEKKLFSNYRPVSLLTNFSKIYEKVMYVRLKSHLDRLKVPSSNQFGFKKNSSTFMSVLDMVDKITDAIDSKQFAMGVFIDLAKAFDTVDHCILLNILCHYGIRGVPLKLATWFRANKLSLNIKKSNFIIFQGRGRSMSQSNIQVRIDDVIIERVDICKFLGLIIDWDLSWKPHIVSVAKTVARNIGVIRYIRQKID